MKASSLLIVFWGLFFTSYAQAQLSVSCLTPDEVQQEVDRFIIKATPLLQTVPLPVVIKYGAMEGFNLSGYAIFNSPTQVDISLFGNNCRGLLGRDALNLLLCHEVGHAAGGAPQMDFLGSPESLPVSSEGQADFFATSSCLPAIFKDEDNLPYLEEFKNFPELNDICTQPDNEEKALCARIALASLNFAVYVHPTEATGSSPPKDPGPRPDLKNKSTIIVASTLTREYPTPQCRLDTFIAGLKCPAKNLFSNYTTAPETEMSCGTKAVEAERPSCWYKKKESSHANSLSL